MNIRLTDLTAWMALLVLLGLGGYLVGGTHGKVKPYGLLVLSGALWPLGYILMGWPAPTWVNSLISSVGDLVVWTIPIFIVVASIARLAKSKVATAWAAGFSTAPYVIYWTYFLVTRASSWGDTWRVMRGEVTHAMGLGRVIGLVLAAVLLSMQAGRARSRRTA